LIFDELVDEVLCSYIRQTVEARWIKEYSCFKAGTVHRSHVYFASKNMVSWLPNHTRRINYKEFYYKFRVFCMLLLENLERILDEIIHLVNVTRDLYNWCNSLKWYL
jgi:hypothetical protein